MVRRAGLEIMNLGTLVIKVVDKAMEGLAL